jgi:hypothetical protein
MRKRYAKAEAAAKQTKNEEVASMIRHTILGLMAAGIFVAGTVAHAAEITTAG